MKNVREVTKKYQPKNQAVWTFEAFYEALNQWAFEIYDKQPHIALDESPRECFINRIYKTGDRASKYIAYDKVFIILTLPSTKKGTAKVYVGQGIRMNNIYYWSDAFKDPNVEGSQVFVRYDPFDMSVAYAYVKNRWIKLRSEYELIFQNRTEKEIKMTSEELRKRKKVTAKDINISGRALAGFLETTEAKELLLMQRLMDNAVRNTLHVIDGGKSKTAEQKKKKMLKKNNSEQKQNSGEHTKSPERKFKVLEEF
ncbi:Mu transposase C-terminal domain-containing protein [Bacillus sp. Bva_UNVM-123]|uniref:Mu transposase C-terminal domain-containing protein n=1 Tax=Bacillus sp. Bva_UNVM-123 TaxID=2829798 RepID=UPI00391F6770